MPWQNWPPPPPDPDEVVDLVRQRDGSYRPKWPKAINWTNLLIFVAAVTAFYLLKEWVRTLARPPRPIDMSPLAPPDTPAPTITYEDGKRIMTFPDGRRFHVPLSE